MKLKIVKIKNVPDPKYINHGDVGLDLHSAENIILKPGERATISTGLKMEIPEGFAGLIWDRSGLAANYGISTLAGVIDSGYRGEIKVAMINLGSGNFEVKEGMRIAQMLFQKVEKADIEIVNELEESKRGDGGFGSTGLH